MWSYIVDGILIFILLFCIIVGIAKGLFDSLLSLIGTGLALVISVFCAKYIAGFINKIFGFEEFILKKLDGSEEGADGFISFFGDKFSISNSDAARFCVWACAVIIMFLAIKLTISILSKLFESITKSSPTISGINRLLGMVFGLVKGAVVVVALLALCSVIGSVPVIGKPVYTAVSEAKITGAIFKYVDEFVEKNVNEDTINNWIENLIPDSETPEAETGNEETTQSGKLTAQN